MGYVINIPRPDLLPGEKLFRKNCLSFETAQVFNEKQKTQNPLKWVLSLSKCGLEREKAINSIENDEILLKFEDVLVSRTSSSFRKYIYVVT